MKKVLIFLVVSLALILSACASAVTPVPTMPASNDNSNMTLAPGASAGVNGTPTPGSMMADNPEAAHMMEPITAPNVQPFDPAQDKPATETTGGQPLEFREEN